MVGPDGRFSKSLIREIPAAHPAEGSRNGTDASSRIRETANGNTHKKIVVRPCRSSVTFVRQPHSEILRMLRNLLRFPLLCFLVVVVSCFATYLHRPHRTLRWVLSRMAAITVVKWTPVFYQK